MIRWLLATLACWAPSVACSSLADTLPLLTASINESRSPVLSRGWPLLLEVDLLHPALFDTNAVPLLITPAVGTWAQSVQVSIVDPAGQSQNWPLHLYNNSSNNITLDADHAGQLLYYLAPSETAALPAGTYTIGAALELTNSPDTNAWQGRVSSVPVQLTLNDEATPLADSDLDAKQKLLASYHLLAGQSSAAGADLDQLLAAQPTNVTALAFKSFLLRLDNQPLQAQELLNAAIEQSYSAFPDSPEPPLALLNQRIQLEQILAAALVVHPIVAGNQLTLVWNSVAGKTYTVETSPDLQTWTPSVTNVIASSALTSWSTSAGTRSAFFRVKQ